MDECPNCKKDVTIGWNTDGSLLCPDCRSKFYPVKTMCRCGFKGEAKDQEELENQMCKHRTIYCYFRWEKK